MKALSLTFQSGNRKAFIFSLDILLAFIIFFILLATANNYMVKGRNPLPDLQTARTGSVIITLLDNKKILQTLNNNTINANLSTILSKDYGIRLNVTCKNTTGQINSFEIGQIKPNNKFIAAGKRFFIVNNATNVKNYCLTKYWIWIK